MLEFAEQRLLHVARQLNAPDRLTQGGYQKDEEAANDQRAKERAYGCPVFQRRRVDRLQEEIPYGNRGQDKDKRSLAPSTKQDGNCDGRIVCKELRPFKKRRKDETQPKARREQGERNSPRPQAWALH